MESCSGDIGNSFSTTKGRTGVRRQGKEGIPVWGYRYPFLAIKRSANQNPTSRLMRVVEDRGMVTTLGEVCVRDWGEGECSTSAKSMTIKRNNASLQGKES